MSVQGCAEGYRCAPRVDSGLTSPLDPRSQFHKYSTHVLPGNQHFTRGEGKNISIICIGFPRVPGPGMKEKVCISWFGGPLWILSNPEGTSYFKLAPGPNAMCLPLGSELHDLPSRAHRTTGSPPAVTRGQVVDAVGQAKESQRLKRDSGDLFNIWPKLCKQKSKDQQASSHLGEMLPAAS